MSETPEASTAIVPAEPDYPKATQEQIDAYLATRGNPPPGRVWCNGATRNGPRRGLPCPKFGIPGGTVCLFHGGKTKHVRRAAARRFKQLVEPSMEGLGLLIDQNEHFPSKLGAIKEVLNRTLGPVDKGGDRGPVSTGTVINLNVAIGGLPPGTQQRLPQVSVNLPTSQAAIVEAVPVVEDE